jgi:hypothetical protein
MNLVHPPVNRFILPINSSERYTLMSSLLLPNILLPSMFSARLDTRELAH